jgi:2-polyprenyl-3-methyl-5-hydroxy-6-metoxy-1,4-benzoquinol methylase
MCAASHVAHVTLILRNYIRECEMLARRELPPEYAKWNRAWAAPYGRRGVVVELFRPFGSRRVRQARGPFAFQGNTTTRMYEYPWAYHQLVGLGPSRVLEIGGALSGLQFVLAKAGHEVHNVDPFVDYGGGNYDVDPVAEHASLNRAFGTNVVLHRSTLPDAELAGSFSAVVCISTLEHLPHDSIDATLRAVKRLLTPGGLVVLTIDLFLNLEPFCSRTTNTWGTNASVAWIDSVLGYPMLTGDRAELYGYPEFSTDRILSQLDEFAIGAGYPQMAQLVTFRRSSSEVAAS